MGNTPTIFYDGSCGLCSDAVRRWRGPLTRAGYAFEPLQSDLARNVLNLTGEEIPEELKLQTADGQILGGVEALLHIARHVGWAWPMYALAFVPGVKGLYRVLYRWIARRRHRISAACHLPAQRR